MERYFIDYLNKFDVAHHLDKNSTRIERFHKLLDGKAYEDVRNNINVLIHGNEISIDKERQFISYQKDALLDSGRKNMSRFLKECNIDSIDSYLDVGCGCGQLPRAAAELGIKRSVGIDIKANGRWAEFQEGYENLEYRIQDITEMTLQEEFEFVTSIAAFEHFENPRLMLERMCTLVSRGGILYIYFAPIWRHTDGAHMYRDVQFPYYHLIFSDEVRLEYYKKFNLNYTVNWFNKWTAFDFMTMFLQCAGMEIIHFCPIFDMKHYWFAHEFSYLLPRYSVEELMISGFRLIYKKL